MDSLPQILPLLIPILGLLIGLVVVGSIFLVYPLVRAVTRLGDAYLSGRSETDEAVARRLEARLGMEGRVAHCDRRTGGDRRAAHAMEA